TEKPVVGQQGSQRPWRHGSVREPGAGGPDEKANHVLDHRGSRRDGAFAGPASQRRIAGVAGPATVGTGPGPDEDGRTGDGREVNPTPVGLTLSDGPAGLPAGTRMGYNCGGGKLSGCRFLLRKAKRESGANPERSRHCNRHRQGTAATALLRGKAVVEIPPEARKPACVRGNVHAFGSKVRMELCGGRLSLQPALSTCPCVGRLFCGRPRFGPPPVPAAALPRRSGGVGGPKKSLGRRSVVQRLHLSLVLLVALLALS